MLPFRPHDKIDIVNVDFVADAISTLHMKANPAYDIYHLSSGNDSQTFRELTRALAAEQNKRGPLFLPILEKPFASIVNTLANRKGPAGHGAALMKVFLPYLDVEYGLRQYASHDGDGPQASAIFAIQFSAAPVQPRAQFRISISSLAGEHKSGRVCRMMDFVLEAWVSSIIEGKKIQWMMGKREPWQRGEKLKLLFAGYNGTRNTGSDVRVEEMLRQVRRILGPENVDLSMMTFNFDRSRGYFDGTSKCGCRIFFRRSWRMKSEESWRGGVRRFDVQNEICERADHHDDRLPRHRSGGKQVSIGYGAEAGHMDPMVRRCAHAFAGIRW